jgi:hypothetical protein
MCYRWVLASVVLLSSVDALCTNLLKKSSLREEHLCAVSLCRSADFGSKRVPVRCADLKRPLN